MEYMSPGSDLDFLFDCTLFLVTGEEVTTATWTLETGLIEGTQTDTITGSTLQVEAPAVAGKAYSLKVVVATNASNTFSRTWFIKVQEQIV